MSLLHIEALAYHMARLRRQWPNILDLYVSFLSMLWYTNDGKLTKDP